MQLLPDVNCGIAAISPIIGCSSGCKYCYLPLKGFSLPYPNGITETQLVEYLLCHPRFLRGREGTFLCIGVWGEMFPSDQDICAVSLSWLRALSTLSNPIAIITKGAIAEETVRQIAELQNYDRHIALLETITTLRLHALLEPNTAEPYGRFQTMDLFQRYGLHTAALINPFISEISDPDYEDILMKLEEIKVANVIISPLYVNGTICKRLSGIPQLQDIIKKYLCGYLHDANHLKDEAYEVSAVEKLEERTDLLATANKHNVQLWHHYSCYLSNIHQRRNLFRIDNPMICIRCGNCEQYK